MAAEKKLPKDAQVMMAILKEMGVTEYEPRVINQMLEFSYRMHCILLCIIMPRLERNQRITHIYLLSLKPLGLALLSTVILALSLVA